jgi:hypothetical protein
MAQVSLYIEDSVLEKARRLAKTKGFSLSRYITEVVKLHDGSEWPDGYWDLFGSLDDDSFERQPDTPIDQVAARLL